MPLKLILVLLGCAALLAGCGGDDDGGSATTPPSSPCRGSTRTATRPTSAR